MPSASRLVARSLAVLTGAALLALGWAAPALAHTELRATTPQEGSTVESLSELRLEFTGDVLEIGAELTLVDADGGEHELAPQFPSVNAVTGRFEDPLPAGPTELRWRIVAEDGHPLEGVLSFTYAGAGEGDAAPQPLAPQTPAPADGAATTAAPDETTPQATPASPTPSASAAAEGDEASDLPAWLLPALAGAAAGGAVVAILAMRARRR